MAPSRARNRANDFDDFLDALPKDFDPEADDVPDGFDDDDSVSEDDAQSADDGRGHYVQVAKSKLQKPKAVPLGPQYRGSMISRDEMDEEMDDDDPFSKEFVNEEDSEEDKADEAVMDGVSGELGQEGQDAEDDETFVRSRSNSSGDEARRAQSQITRAISEKSRKGMEKYFNTDQKGMAASLSQSIKDDAEKGRAVKKQRATFDSLMNVRIKLQKSLVATNTIVGLEETQPNEEGLQAVEAAETAALRLWSSLNDFREDIVAARTGEKRKRSVIDTRTPTEELWTYLHTQDQDSLSRWNSSLQRWSTKAQDRLALSGTRRSQSSESSRSITDVVSSHIQDPTHLLKRAHTPRSCAPLQLAKQVTSDPNIYDDADFYGLLLKEVLEQKSQDSLVASAVDLDFDAAIGRQAKTKKQVDTKASKGRKLRYTVHEKLQNFVAPEDRTTWGSRQADELFGSLFGGRVELDERETDEEGDDADAGLMMFRS